MSSSNPINLSSDSSSSDSDWDNFVLSNPTRVEKDEYEKVSLRKRARMSMNITIAGLSQRQSVPQDDVTKENSSSMSSYISPYEDTDDETSLQAVSVPPLAAVTPNERLLVPPARSALPPAGPSSSSSTVREVVSGLACPRVYEWINMRGAPKVMPKWAIPKKP